MIVLIPLGGIGKRFKDNGYMRPKALINIFGKPILYYLLDNLNLDNVSFVYIPYNYEYSNYNFENVLKKDYPNINFKFLCLTNNTRGAAETINIALKKLDVLDMPILCLDGDNFYLNNIVKKWNGDNKIFTFEDQSLNPIYSYIEYKNDTVISIKEKEKISDYACTGAYGFRSYIELKNYSSKILEKNIKQKDEFYTSGIISEMIKNNIYFSNVTINYNDFICLGTPIHLKTFYNNFPKYSCLNGNSIISNKRICFDLDNTLVTFPEIIGDYRTVKPITKNISLLKYLKKFNNTIIIYTARRMKTYKGNMGSVLADIGKITFNTLEKFDIPYDEIYFGKPQADFYIDDLGINAFSDIEKEIGYYNSFVKPRDFNIVETSNIEIITKKGNDLEGEIYYYNNIPNEIKDMFPIFINSTNNFYQIEKIYGLTVTELYLSENLTKNTLEHILNSIDRIHRLNLYERNDAQVNIYDNYLKKLESRYKNFDYSKFYKSDEIFLELKHKLGKYIQQNSGKKTIIHGDPVFTNILINRYDKIKFIDMRGKIGNIKTIYGDSFYDWAKVYQSLIGYDSILQNKKISKKYEYEMIDFFKEFFIKKFSNEDFKNLKIITKSLLFTLIPLHNNEKCQYYYSLIKSIHLQ
tara:strand:- start:223 stop:2133 length:1911 start_codon:yes stop_codon:yes gene_type:complete